MNPENNELYARLYKENIRGMYQYAISLLEDGYLAEYAVQEAFSIAWAKFEALKTSPNQGGWLTNTLKNIVMRIIKENSRARNSILSLDEVSEEHIQVSDELSLSALYEGIVSKEELDMLQKLYVQRYSYEELAAEYGIPVSTLGMRAKRAKEKFLKVFN